MVNYISLELFTGSKSKDFGLQSDDEEDVGAVMAASRQTRLYLKAPDGQILSMYRAILFNKKVCIGISYGR